MNSESPTLRTSATRVLHVFETWGADRVAIDTFRAVDVGDVIRAQRSVGLEVSVALSSLQHARHLEPDSAQVAEVDDGAIAGAAVAVAPVTRQEQGMRRLLGSHIDKRAFENWLGNEVLRVRPDIVHVHWSESIGPSSIRVAHKHGVSVLAEVGADRADVVGLGSYLAPLGTGARWLRERHERHLDSADAVVTTDEIVPELLIRNPDLSPIVIDGGAPATSQAAQFNNVYSATIRARHTPGRTSPDRISPPVRDPRLDSGAPDRADRIAAIAERPAAIDAEPDRNLLVIGAGPAGLTAALEAARRSELRPVVLEASNEIGGISRTTNFDGNLIDIGGHRFFSKSQRVNDWWLSVLPLAKGATWRPGVVSNGPDPHIEDRVMLVRSRKSQILWNGSLFDYPLELSFDVLRKLGLRRTVRAGLSYLRAQAFPVSPVDNLEDFYINRFGRELYRTFFESYTEKVWGLPCREISPDWGAQRVKGLSLWGALVHAVKPNRSTDDAQRDVATSLIERFLYPKFGPGQMWETAAADVLDAGGEVLTNMAVVGFDVERLDDDDSVGFNGNPTDAQISVVHAIDRVSGEQLSVRAEHIVSTMPLNALVKALGDNVSANAHEIADGLSFRDFITVGVLVDNLLLTEDDGAALLDNWLYIQEPSVLVGRLQIFNNWSPWMVADPHRSWIGLEYFCDTTDPMWSWPQDRLVRLADQELAAIGVIEAGSVIKGCAIKVRRAYPSYVGTYDRLGELQPELSTLSNLWCTGRNGQHRYNNQDHSMLASMLAIDQIEQGTRDPEMIWAVNIDDDYHEGD